MRVATSVRILVVGCLLLAAEARLLSQTPGAQTPGEQAPGAQTPGSLTPEAFDPSQLPPEDRPQKKAESQEHTIGAEPNLQLFAVLAAINAAGFDAGMEKPELVPVRAAVREELAQRTIPVLADLQAFYRSHELRAPDQNLSQYISLALFLTPPPELELVAQNPANLPAEIWDLRDMVPLLAAFYQQADIAGLWQKYLPAMEQESDRYRKLLARVILETNSYLRMDTPAAPERGFAIYINPLGTPNQTQARNYGDQYSLVVGPADELAEADIRHGWLHYLLDPFPYRNAQVVESKRGLHQIIERLPGLDPAFRGNFRLLLTESLIRAIQARRMPGDAAAKQKAAHEAVEEGLYLTDYFFEAMAKFEQQPVGMRLYYSEMIEGISVADERKRLADVQFRVRPSHFREMPLNSLEEITLRGESSISQGQFAEAGEIFESALKQFGPQPRILYGLAIVATQQKQPERAKEYFAQAASLATDTRTKAWSQIYLGRLLDLEGKRPEAVRAYQAALEAGDPSPDTREAAEKGVKEGFISPNGPPPGAANPEEKGRKRVPLGTRP